MTCPHESTVPRRSLRRQPKDHHCPWSSQAKHSSSRNLRLGSARFVSDLDDEPLRSFDANQCKSMRESMSKWILNNLPHLYIEVHRINTVVCHRQSAQQLFYFGHKKSLRLAQRWSVVCQVVVRHVSISTLPLWTFSPKTTYLRRHGSPKTAVPPLVHT